MEIRTPIKVDLTRGKSTIGFYPNTNKGYTEIQEGKLPWNVLDILINDPIRKDIGANMLTLVGLVTSRDPELTVDKYGDNQATRILIRDFVKAGLLEQFYDKYRVTSLGKEFFKFNTIKSI